MLHFLDTGASENLIWLLFFEFFHSQTGQLDIRDSRAERIYLSHLAVIFIQCKDSSVAGHALSMLKFAFFSLDTMTAAASLKSVWLFLLIVAYNYIGFVFAAFSLSFVIALHWLWPI